MLKYLSLAGVLAVSACASMTDGQPAGTKLASNGTTCRSYRETGSVMPGKRICHNAAEWQAIDAQKQQETDTLLGNQGRQRGTGNALN